MSLVYPCLRCGLCCRGVLFDYGLVQEAEYRQYAVAWEEAGVRITDHAHEHRFYLPCAAYQENTGTCACYAIRPQTCAQFRCALLRRYQAGELPDAEFQRIIERIHRLWTALQSKLRLHPAIEADAPFYLQLQQFRHWYATTDSSHSTHLMVEQRALLLLFEHYFWSATPDNP